MTFIVKSMTTFCEDIKQLVPVFIHPDSNGYNPLIIRARQQFLSVFGKNLSVEDILQELWLSESFLRPPSEVDIEWTRALLLYESITRREKRLLGDVFLAPEGKGLLYTLLKPVRKDTPDTRSQDAKKKESAFLLEIGFLGDEEEVRYLNDFATLVAVGMFGENRKAKWRPLQSYSIVFDKFSHSDAAKYVTADTVSSEDTALAEMFEDQVLREVAIVVKRSGGMLAEDVVKKVTNQNEASNAIEQLVQTHLLTREYVIICCQTSNQINRMTSRDAVDKMAEAGVRCSCGGAIADERIEELFSPTSSLQRMLNQSYWTTAKLVCASTTWCAR